MGKCQNPALKDSDEEDNRYLVFFQVVALFIRDTCP